MIPLPRAWLLAGGMLVGSAVGQILAVAFSVLSHARIRPDVAIALVISVPSVIGLALVLFSGRRWVTALGAGILALGPGWFGMLAALRVVAGG
ncbi:putative holin [Mycobacterium vicinigordonae]|uniref:Putative holin n=1 Tax=Mycobacterium vicinigordonae TaxID=1719132 RepID=A0A7D6E0R9_9MYCO|nr:putative holin [Mycobacterium vicinigordonae]QLL08150.1 putative holin [Mycobacterium vicinigordonae]